MADAALHLRLKALISFRALFVSLLLGSAFIFKIDFFPNPRAISLFIIWLYVLTIIYVLLIRRAKKVFLFAYIQLVLDVFAEIVLIYITGGIESWFSFTLILTVLSSSIVLNQKAGYIVASMSCILYGTLLDLQFYRLIPIPYEGIMLEKQFLYNIFIHTVSLFVTAYLAGYLSSRLEETVEKLAEKDSHLRDLEIFNTKVIESLPSGLVTTDIDGNVIIFNRAAEKIIGIAKNDIIGRTIENALPFLKIPIREGRREEVLSRHNHASKIIGIHISILRDLNGRETGFIGIFQDLTVLKELEEEMKNKEKWAAIGELSANIAHEIRNPLASLRGSIEMLREGKIPEKHRDNLMGIVINETERLNTIVTDFLTYSRPKPLDIQKVDLNALLSDTLELLRNTAQDKGDIIVRQESEGALLVSLDPLKIRQVFWNLGVNALEAIEKGGELTVSTEETQDKVSIIFSDTGTGMSKDEVEKIFYPFHTTKERGTGLGLSIAYRIIEEHQGRIVVQSTPGSGTTFEIILPRTYGT
jgi:two-component system, NtrC family, sensor histidine kinase PilS